MTELNPPGFMQNRTDHSARIVRRAISGLISTEGIVNASDWLVTQRAAGVDMSVDIAGGEGYIKGTEDVNQGFYHCISDSTPVNKAVTAAHASLARKDIVVARVYDQFYSGATNLWQFEVIAGTPSATPVVPATPNNALVIATVNIASLQASIANVNIDSTRATMRLRDASSILYFSLQTGSYTLVLADAGKQVEINAAGANSLTVPSNSSVPFPIGTVILGAQTGAGQTTITPGAGVTINATPGLKVRAQWAPFSLTKRGTDTWLAAGDLSA